ncbi:MAG: hypothetical protein P8N76_24720 [Pirellulaceae bacterium]|nr:hypothetical protein [Pirellulaceae bacterium]
MLPLFLNQLSRFNKLWVAAAFLTCFALEAAAEPTVYVTMVSHFDRPWAMTQGDLEALKKLTKLHPTMRWTHLYNPVAYTQETPLREAMERFVKQTRNHHGAEIGTHLHMYESLLTAAGVKFVTHPSVNAEQTEGSRDDSGYAVPITRYSREEIGKLLEYTRKTFEDRELGHPKTFCAGFYATSLDLQNMIASHGYTTSAAAFPTQTLFGSQYAPSWHALSGWDASVTYKSSPYRISQISILPNHQAPFISAIDKQPLVEIPQTCKIDWMVSAEDMKIIFKEHLAMARKGTTTAICLAIHETSSEEQFNKFHEVLRYIDEHINSGSQPQVKYITTAELRDRILQLD